jgi:hypothetical protein
MKRLLIAALFTAVVGLGASTALADEKVDVSAVITKADAEKILGMPVKDARGQNKEFKDGFYDSEWSYYATKGDKALVFDFLVGPPGLAATMLSALPTGTTIHETARLAMLDNLASFGNGTNGQPLGVFSNIRGPHGSAQETEF